MTPTVPCGTVTRLRSIATAMRLMSKLAYVVRECPPAGPKGAGGQAMCPLRLDSAGAGRIESQCASGESEARRKAPLLVLSRSGGLQGPMFAVPLHGRLSASDGSGPIPRQGQPRSKVPSLRTADAMRTARRAPVVRAGVGGGLASRPHRSADFRTRDSWGCAGRW
jgi:hypothetical protein